MLDLSIIIVNYNTKQLLVDCVKSIINTTKNISYEIIVVDNNSTDNSVLSIKKKVLSIKNLKIIENEKNVGFSRANNIGIEKAKGRYILFLNSDTIVYSNTLEKMIEFMDEYQDAGAATCKVVLPSGELDDASHRGFPTPLNSLYYFSGLSKIFPKSKNFAGYNLSYIDVNTTHEIDACAGAFMIVRKEAGKKIGWWDEDYFWYGDDLDFCYRLKNFGFKIYYVPTVSVLHYKGVSGGIKEISKHLTTANKETQKQAMDARFNAMKIFYNKHYKNDYPWFVNWIVYKGIDLRRLLNFRG